MINRVLIRIKVVQMLYSYFLTKEEKTFADAKKELKKSLEMAYQLYNYIFVLMVELTDMQDRRLDAARNKYLPSEEDLHPNMKFVENQFIKKLRNSSAFIEYQKEHKLTWHDDDIFLKLLLDKIIKSNVYTEYMSNSNNDFVADCELWRDLLKRVILVDDDFTDQLESKSVYWNDDIETIGTFVLKSIKRFETCEEKAFMPMYKDEEDSRFGEQLFTLTVQNRDKCDELINRFIQTENWDTERVAFMDRVVMDVAITEVLNYPAIPTRVSLNEYIEIAKYYSTPRSGQFVNGILNSIINHLKDERIIVKE